uniref:Uncharacterized protein n=1 Tax=Anguilla anguilla TaxID=7936 RepID=A0A0E9PTN9_ANGAN
MAFKGCCYTSESLPG